MSDSDYPVDCNPPGSSVYGISQVRILEWVAISFSKESSQTRDQTWVSCIAGRFFTNWDTREDVLTKSNFRGKFKEICDREFSPMN